jgi:IstB-like ATP binding protein
VDLELESRNSRSVERRFRLSRLHARHSIDSFHFKHHKSRTELKARILWLLDLEFLHNGSGAIFIGNPGVGTPSSRKSSAGALARRTSACSSPPPWKCSITCSHMPGTDF